ncbi:MAG: isochorismatase family protein [Alphaproteobacteria bacterium]|nr:isochorismatase family protein [Alphaproteobacteria bacterium]
MTQDALLIVDMQQEFLSPEGFFKRPVRAKPLLDPITALVRAARDQGRPVVWIRSVYPIRDAAPPPVWPARLPGPRFAEVPMNTERLASGHAGRPCCAPGSPLCDLHPALAPLVQPDDLVITKERYSAFTDTGLAERLRAMGVGRVLLCGLVANVCVRATAADAFFHGFEVVAVSDGVGATSGTRLKEGLSAIEKHYGALQVSHEVLTAWRADQRGLGAGDSAVLYGVLPPALDAAAFAAVRDEVGWQDMFHRGGVVPRRVAIQGEIVDGRAPVYRHPADAQPELVPFTPTVERLRRLVEARIGQPLNHALIQRYLDGHANISAHADKTLDIARGSAVVNLSLGATRAMVLVAKVKGPDGSRHSERVDLPHGSVFLLGWSTNQQYQHAIRPDRREAQEKRPDELRDGGERISLTFRHITTFIDADGRLSGQGARSADAPEEDPLAQAERMLIAFRDENRDPAFDWDAAYGGGFDALNFEILRRPDA